MATKHKICFAIKDAFSNKKMGALFCLKKRPNEGGLVKDQAFSHFNPSLIWLNTCLLRIAILWSVGSTVKKNVVISGLHSERLKGWGVGVEGLLRIFSRTGSLVSDKKSIQLTHIFIECLYSIHFNKTINFPQSFILLSPFPFRPPLFQKTHHLCLIPLQIFLENCFCKSTSVVSPDSSSVSLSSADSSLWTASAVAFSSAII